jgi:hypothetical protein
MYIIVYIYKYTIEFCKELYILYSYNISYNNCSVVLTTVCIMDHNGIIKI